MKTLWKSLIEKHGSWWVGAIVGDFRYSFVCHPDYAHLPKSVRRKAAGKAVKASFRRLSFWIALGVMFAIVAGLCLMDRYFGVSDKNGTFGAVIGFIIGEMFLVKAIYRGGIESYEAGLPVTNGDEEQAAALNGP